MTVRRAESEMTATEFLRWKLFIILEEEDNWKKTTADQFYAARGAYQTYLLQHVVSNMLAKYPREPELEFKDFLLDFKKAIKKAERVEPAASKVTEEVEEKEDDDWWGDSTLELAETDEERQVRFELANLNAHNRWAAFLGVTLTEVGADKFVKAPDEIEFRSEAE